MRIEGQCEICKTKGDWEAGLFEDAANVFDRPQKWAALYPVKPSRLPEGCNFLPESLEKYGVTTKFVCPKCKRKLRK